MASIPLIIPAGSPRNPRPVDIPKLEDRMAVKPGDQIYSPPSKPGSTTPKQGG